LFRLSLPLLMALSLLSLNAQTPEAPAKFAVELPNPGGPPFYATLESGNANTLISGPHLRLLADQPAAKKPSALKLEYKADGGLVRITATLFYGEFDLSSPTPQNLRNVLQESAGSYSGKLNDEVRLSGMEQAGLEPITLKIVPAQGPLSLRPQTVSKAPSIEFAMSDENRMTYKLTLRNLSSKTVTGYLIDMPGPNDNSSSIALGPSAIAPGASTTQVFGIPHGGRMKDGQFVEDPPPPFLVLEAVLFVDGTYEGDVAAAAQMTAQRAANDIQLDRIDRVVEALLQDGQADDRLLVARIRSAVAELTEEPDLELVNSIRSRFPDLPGQAMTGVNSSLHVGLNSGKQVLEHSLAEYERTLSDTRHLTVAAWWQHWRVRSASRLQPAALQEH
jgi:hypothetical protein